MLSGRPADWIIGTEQRLVLPLVPSASDALKPSAIFTFQTKRAKRVVSMEYSEVNVSKETWAGSPSLIVTHSDGSVWRMHGFSWQMRDLLYNFLQEAHRIACEQGFVQGTSMANFDKRRKAQEIMSAAREGKPLPAEFLERLKLFQAGIRICPACGGSSIDRRMGTTDSAITTGMVAGTVLTGGALLLPAAAWAFMGKKEFCYTCKECGFTWQPAVPEA